MKLDRSKSYTIDNYTFENFVNLTEQELEMVLEWRNNEGVRKWMTNTKVIPLEKHMQFVESLSKRDDLYYWLVYRDNVPVGVVDISSVDMEDDSSETGYYLNPEHLDSGAGFEFFYYFKLFIHDSLSISKTSGLMLKENINSFMLIKYFGGKAVGTKSIDGDFYYLMETTKTGFNAVKEGANDMLKFAKYIRKNKMEFGNFLKENSL